MRVSTVVLIVAFLALFWVYHNFEPRPAAPPTAVVPPGFVPDPNYTWVPRTNVRKPKEPVTTTPTTTSPQVTTTTTSPGETISPTSPTETPTTIVIDPDGPGPLPPLTITPPQLPAPTPPPPTTAPIGPGPVPTTAAPPQ